MFQDRALKIYVFELNDAICNLGRYGPLSIPACLAVQFFWTRYNLYVASKING